MRYDKGGAKVITIGRRRSIRFRVPRREGTLLRDIVFTSWHHCYESADKTNYALSEISTVDWRESQRPRAIYPYPGRCCGWCQYISLVYRVFSFYNLV